MPDLPYWVWLVVISVAFVVAERLWPWRRWQAAARRGVVTDLVYLVFNGHVLGVFLAPALAVWLGGVLAAIDGARAGEGLLSGWPWAAQFAVGFVVIDFAQWWIHRMLHRVPMLWAIHRVHHSIERMDWAGNFRFHWLEVVVYRALLYVPLAIAGIAPPVLLAMAIASTAIGHFNHANVRVRLGPLRYLLNHPGMHIWHHDRHADRHRPYGVNFGINLSVWDFLFGTAYLPKNREAPDDLGFDGIETFPSNILTQQLAPMWRPQPTPPTGNGMRSVCRSEGRAS